MFGYKGSTGNVRDFQLFLLVFQLFSRMSWPVRCSIFVRFSCSFIMHYTAEEYTDMIICYGIAMENALAAERIYAERFPNRRHPSHITISRCVRRSKETGFLLPQKQHFVNVPVRRQVNIDEQVLREFEENPNYSIRRVARTLGITRNMVHRIIKQNGLHPFHYQRVQQLLPRDEGPRIYFCEGIFIFHPFLHLHILSKQ